MISDQQCRGNRHQLQPQTLPEYNDNQMVVAYYRYSSASQNEASIEQQREMVQRWASSQGLLVVSEYEDAAKTGTTADRPG